MSRLARSILWFGSYLFIAGVSFAIAPNAILPQLGMAKTDEPWIRVLGIVVAILALYYFSAVRHDWEPFMRATIWARALVLPAFALLVILSRAPAMILVFGVIDGMGALWTWSSLRTSKRAA